MTFQSITLIKPKRENLAYKITFVKSGRIL